MDKETKKAMAEWMKGQSLLDCFDQYSDKDNHNLRIIFEVIHYLLGVNNLLDYLKREKEIVSELKESFPGLMTIGAVADLDIEPYRYFDIIEEMFNNQEEI